LCWFYIDFKGAFKAYLPFIWFRLK